MPWTASAVRSLIPLLRNSKVSPASPYTSNRMMRLRLVLAVAAAVFALVPSSRGADASIAVLPVFYDFELQTKKSEFVRQLHFGIQAQLLENYDVILRSRADLTILTFDSALTANSGDFRIEPANIVLLTVFESNRSVLRVYPIRIKEKVDFPNPIQIKVKGKGRLDLNKLAAEAATKVALRLKLKTRETEAEIVDRKEAIKVAVFGGNETGAQFQEQADDSVAGEMALLISESALSEMEGVTLLDRSDVVSTVSEAQLRELSTVDESTLAHILGADFLVQVEGMQVDAKTAQALFFVIDPSRASILAATSFDSNAINEEALRDFFNRAFCLQYTDQQTEGDPARMIRHEADFYESQVGRTLGLRMEAESKWAYNLGFGQAAVGLMTGYEEDYSEFLRDVVYYACSNEVHQHYYEFHPETTSSNGNRDAYMAYREEVRKRFGLAVASVAAREDFHSVFVQADFWNAVGEWERALAVIKAADPEIQEEGALYYQEAYALFRLGRTREAAQRILDRGRFSTPAMELCVDGLRAAGDIEEEYRIRRVNARNFQNLDDQLRLLQLSLELGEPENGIHDWKEVSSSGYANDPRLLIELIRCLDLLGESELASGVAQSMALMKELDEDKVPDKLLAEAKQFMLPEVGSRIPADYSDWGSGCQIELLGDSGFPEDTMREAAQSMANFWGCEVLVYPEIFDFKTSKNYDPVRDVLFGSTEVNVLRYFSYPDSGKVIGRHVMTNRKMNFTSGRNLDVAWVSGRSIMLLSDHYVRRFKDPHKRPMGEQLSIWLSGAPFYKEAVDLVYKLDGKEFPPFFIGPYTFGYNSYLTLNWVILGLNPVNAACFERVPPQQMQEIFAQRMRKDQSGLKGLSPESTARMEAASRRYEEATPIVVRPAR